MLYIIYDVIYDICKYVTEMLWIHLLAEKGGALSGDVIELPCCFFGAVAVNRRDMIGTHKELKTEWKLSVCKWLKVLYVNECIAGICSMYTVLARSFLC